ncbi:MAG: WG repeat-containing protein [Spirochaetia bacterium]|nr:WG repeat-containing protein [Spirochaetia bacterium]
MKGIQRLIVLGLALLVPAAVFPYEYLDFDTTRWDADTLLPFVEKGKVGYLDQKGKPVLPAQFEYGGFFGSGRALVRANGKYGYIDREGTLVIPLQFDGASEFQGGVAPVSSQRGGRSFAKLIDTKGAAVEQHEFVSIRHCNGVLFAQDVRDGNWAVMLPNGRVITEYLFAESVDHNTESTPDWADRDFVEMRPVLGRDIHPSGGLIQYTAKGKYGYMDLQGNIVLPARYDFAHSFRGDEAVVKEGGRWGIINRSGKYVMEPKYDRLQGAGFSEGLCGVRVGRRWGYMDRSGAVVIKPQFLYVDEFSDGMAGFAADSGYGRQRFKFGYIDRAGRIVHPAGRVAIGPFRNGHAWQISSICSGMQAIIDKRGQPYVPQGMVELSRMSPNTWTFTGEDSRQVVVDAQTKVELIRTRDPVDRLFPVTPSIFQVRFSDSRERVDYGYIDAQGSVIARFSATTAADIKRVRSQF